MKLRKRLSEHSSPLLAALLVNVLSGSLDARLNLLFEIKYLFTKNKMARYAAAASQCAGSGIAQLRAQQHEQQHW